MGEKFPINNEIDSAVGNDNPWQKMAEQAPPFNPEQKQGAQIANDSELVQRMVNANDEVEDELEYYVERLELQNGDLYYDQEEDLKKFFNPENRDEDKTMAESIEAEIARRQEITTILTDALGEQSNGNKESQGKSIEEILQAKIDGLVEQMEKIYDTDTMDGVPEAMRGQYEGLTAKKQRLDEALTWIKLERKYPSGDSKEARETEREISAINVEDIMDQMDAERDAYTKNLEAVGKERQRRLEWEKSHYGFVEGEGRAPMSVLAAEEDMSRLQSKIIQKEKDTDLLYKIYKENGKNQSLSKTDMQSIVDRMIQDRDAKMAEIDKKLEKAEKKSEEWKKLKQERAEAYRAVPDDAVERIMKLFN